jgi:hypothetical protein
MLKLKLFLYFNGFFLLNPTFHFVELWVLETTFGKNEHVKCISYRIIWVLSK